MNRYYFISDDLKELAQVEKELGSHGIEIPQIHVLSRDDAGVQKHNLPQVSDFMKKDVVRATTWAAVLGVVAAAIVLVAAYFLGWTAAWGWTPFVFLAVVVLGFVTWEGGLWGIQEPNEKIRRFQEALNQGKHILFVEVSSDEEAGLREVVDRYPRLQEAGQEPARTDLWVGVGKGWRRFIKWAP